MSKDWRSGLQGRLKALEDSVDNLTDGVVSSDSFVGDLTGHLTDPNFATPVNAEAATADIYYDRLTNVTATKKYTLQGQAYTFKVTVTANYDVKVGATARESFENLRNAILMTQAPGVGDNAASGKYKVPAASPYVASIVHDTYNDVLLITATPPGAAGNAYTLTTDEPSAPPDSFADLDTGVDGTVGSKGAVLFDEDFVSFASDDNSVAGQNWEKVPFGFPSDAALRFRSVEEEPTVAGLSPKIAGKRVEPFMTHFDAEYNTAANGIAVIGLGVFESRSVLLGMTVQSDVAPHGVGSFTSAKIYAGTTHGMDIATAEYEGVIGAITSPGDLYVEVLDTATPVQDISGKLKVWVWGLRLVDDAT